MKRGITTSPFTFAEALAALLVTSILLPVLFSAVLVAHRASEVAQRSEAAARLAQAKLTELTVTGDWQDAEPSGEFEEWPGYTWQLDIEDWAEDDELTTSMTELTITVFFPVQEKQLAIRISTLVAAEES
ncbi:MAG: hypothetical protein HN742_03010 [Lentisphaerae bacterium]|jgi:hypothetical protein|nr:hypothetical protein [Lentisphaerota bacterium]MBT4814914.1 hypothetical protein [Lentisphaerota bacterium]MBT5605439.1 hypothetical protein [Lentisphaerota bacterium]MBT7060130.1 hypothetical protein [Lentisphaerota bacterium]MBT7840810.1 hypothetical protein [Lentisphaerota bacterium]